MATRDPPVPTRLSEHVHLGVSGIELPRLPELVEIGLVDDGDRRPRADLADRLDDVLDRTLGEAAGNHLPQVVAQRLVALEADPTAGDPHRVPSEEPQVRVHLLDAMSAR